jgi:hypothetical protein
MWRSMIVLALCLGFAPAPSAFAAAPKHAKAAKTAEPMSSREVVAEVRRIIAENYVLPDKRPLLDKALGDGLAAGRYDVTEPAELAERISVDLRNAVHDQHLNMQFNPRRAEAQDRADTGPTKKSPASVDDPARDINQGVTDLRILPGNVRYMAYDQFAWTGAKSAAAIDRAMQFLADGDAAIIDIRRNGGGDEAAIVRLISYFLPPNRPLFTSYYGSGKERSRSLKKLPGPRMIGKLLYVLISGNTGSAAEAFAGAVAGAHIGELVGERTNGAGYHNSLKPIDNRFILSVSVGRAVIDATGRDWEAVGIQPTIQTDVDQALYVAQLKALRRLAKDAATPERKARLDALAAAAAAQVARAAPSLPLTHYVGTFGERTITLEDGRLYYTRRARALRTALIPLGGNRFALETDPTQVFDFVASGADVTAYNFGSADAGSSARFERTQ